MKLRTVKTPAAIIAMLFLAACSYSFEISVSGSPDTGLHFALSRPMHNKPIDLNKFMVVTKTEGSWDYKHPVWSVSLPPGTSSEVNEIIYGVVPTGFSEEYKPAKLGRLTSYLALAFSAGGGASTEFTVKQ